MIPDSQNRRARLHELTLVSRRNGRPLFIAGTPLTVLARDPQLAAREMMQNRDPALWSVRARPLAPLA